MADMSETLEQAFLNALRAGAKERRDDVSVLREPRVFFSLVADNLGDIDPKYKNPLMSVCGVNPNDSQTHHYLDAFYSAAQQGSLKALTYAVSQSVEQLYDLQGIDKALGEQIFSALASAIASHLDIDDGGVQQENDGLRRKVLIIVVLLAFVALAVAAIVFGRLLLGGNPEGRHRVPEDTDETKQSQVEVAVRQDEESSETNPMEKPVKAVVTFDANGADGDDVPESITCDTGTQIELPSSGQLRLEGFAFGGWGETSEATQTLAAGETYAVEGDVTLYAIWNDALRLSSQLEISEVAFAQDDGSYKAMAFVTNNSDSTVDLRGDVDFLDKSGNVVESFGDSAWSVGPGEKSLLTNQSTQPGVEGAKWTITTSAPLMGGSSALRFLDASIQDVTDKGVTVKVKNTGDRPAWLMFCTVCGRDERDQYELQSNLVEDAKQKIEPGKSTTLHFEGDHWQDLDNEVYLYGYADKYDGE